MNDIKLRAARSVDKDFVHRVHDEAYRDVVVRQFGRWNQQEEDVFFEAIGRTKVYR